MKAIDVRGRRGNRFIANSGDARRPTSTRVQALSAVNFYGKLFRAAAMSAAIRYLDACPTRVEG
jgi:hypothetical protein